MLLLFLSSRLHCSPAVHFHCLGSSFDTFTPPTVSSTRRRARLFHLAMPDSSRTILLRCCHTGSRAKLVAARACSRRLDHACLKSSSLRCQQCAATTASASSPPLPEPVVVPDKESRDKLDFLSNDPFGATLAKVEALYLAVGEEDLSASDEQAILASDV